MAPVPQVLIAVLLAQNAPAPRGFTDSQAASQRTLETRLRQIPDAKRLRAYQARMAAEPHHAGSPGSRAVAEYARALFQEFGLEARIETFEAMLPYPKTRLLELIEPNRAPLKIAEPPIPGDPATTDPSGHLPPYNAYSASGDVTAPLVYVNYGTLEDYETLKKLGIDVRGKIVLARYGRSWRGVKPKLAAENGAVGCLIYSDPREDGYYRGDVYPKGRYRPAAGVQRGSVMDMPLHPGDPLSPGFASVPGGKRLPVKDARTLMKIPVMPISYQDAQPLLAALGGPVAPEEWRGALPVTYHIGPGPAKVRLKLELDTATRPVHNVIATLPGAAFPDQWILYGNHHDAWVTGAADPVSGAAAVLETARTLSELRKQGWKPARTIKFCLWDAEEFGIIGSTEWVEQHKQELRAKAVAYLNSDTTGAGPMSATGSAPLEAFLLQVASEFQDPKSGQPVWPEKRRTLGALGAGSDYVAFVHHLGIPALNLAFDTDMGGVYHSAYDTLAWYEKFGDPGMAHTRVFTQLMATALARLADAAILPFEYRRFVNTVDSYLRELQPAAASVDLDPLREELSKLKRAAADYESALQNAIKSKAPAAKLAAANAILLTADRALLIREGLPGRPWYRHAITAPGLYTGYGAKTLPGVREQIEQRRLDEAQRQAKLLEQALAEYRGRITEAAKALAGGV